MALVPTDLADTKLFEGEQPEVLAWVLEVADELTLEPGEVLLSPEAMNRYLYLIIEGSVRIELNTGERPVIAHIPAGECIGELSVLDNKPPAAYAVADTPCRLLAIPRKQILMLIDRSRHVAVNLINLLSARVRRDDDSLGESLALQRLHERNARIDALTGLYNRRWLEQMMPRLVERAHADRRNLGLMMVDVDHFKRFNDRYGHPAGDEALRSVGNAILDHIRPNDSAVRYGGEEFVIILPDIERQELIDAAERLRQLIRGRPIVDHEGTTLPAVTVSIGVALLGREMNGEELLSVADQALYRAKAGGRDRVVVADAEASGEKAGC